MGVDAGVMTVVLRRDGHGTVVDLPPVDLASVRPPAGGDVTWLVWTWVLVDPDPLGRVRAVPWIRGQSRGHRPPPETVAGDVIEFARITAVGGVEQFRVRWFAVVDAVRNGSLTVTGGYLDLPAALADGACLAELNRVVDSVDLSAGSETPDDGYDEGLEGYLGY